MTAPVLISIHVGYPMKHGVHGAKDPMDRPWVSAIYKQSVSGRLWLGRTNLRGDAQADLRYHGGPEKAILAYSAEHYPAWRKQLNLPDMPYGAFGENFTLTAVTEDSICIGDIFAIGEARIQVSQPRTPCWKLSRRWRIKDLSAQVETVGRAGWYHRVLVEGYVEAGLPLTLVDRFFPQWTVARVFEIMHHQPTDLKAAVVLAACPLLSPGWREQFLARVSSRPISQPQE